MIPVALLASSVVVSAQERQNGSTVHKFAPSGTNTDHLSIQKHQDKSKNETSSGAEMPTATILELGDITGESCGDTIRQVRSANGQPKLDRQPASADKPFLMAAVNKRIDGCSMMQAHGNSSDLRPIPEAKAQPRLVPAQ
jgi:hypothetical protein